MVGAANTSVVLMGGASCTPAPLSNGKLVLDVITVITLCSVTNHSKPAAVSAPGAASTTLSAVPLIIQGQRAYSVAFLTPLKVVESWDGGQPGHLWLLLHWTSNSSGFQGLCLPGRLPTKTQDGTAGHI